MFELLDDGFRFDTEKSEDSRQDHVEFPSAQIKKAQIRDGGDQLHIETTVNGNWDSYGNSADLRRIRRKPHAVPCGRGTRRPH